MKYCLVDVLFNNVYFGETGAEALVQILNLVSIEKDVGWGFSVGILHYKPFVLSHSYNKEKFTLAEAKKDAIHHLMIQITNGKFPRYKFYNEI